MISPIKHCGIRTTVFTAAVCRAAKEFRIVLGLSWIVFSSSPPYSCLLLPNTTALLANAGKRRISDTSQDTFYMGMASRDTALVLNAQHIPSNCHSC